MQSDQNTSEERASCETQEIRPAKVLKNALSALQELMKDLKGTGVSPQSIKGLQSLTEEVRRRAEDHVVRFSGFSHWRDHATEGGSSFPSYQLVVGPLQFLPAATTWLHVRKLCNERSLAEGRTPAYDLSRVLSVDAIESGRRLYANLNCDGWRLPTPTEWVTTLRFDSLVEQDHESHGEHGHMFELLEPSSFHPQRKMARLVFGSLQAGHPFSCTGKISDQPGTNAGFRMVRYVGLAEEE